MNLSCPICGNKEGIRESYVKKIHPKADVKYNNLFYVCCPKCLTYFQAPFPDKAQYMEILNDTKGVAFEYFSHDFLEKPQSELNDALAGMYRLMQDLKDKYKLKGSIFDVGYGVGEFVYKLNLLGFSAEGIEPSKIGIEHCRKRGVGEDMVKNVLITDYSFTHQFEIVTLLNSWETLYNPIEVLDICIKQLTPNGFLVIKTQTLIDGFWESVPVGELFRPFNLFVMETGNLVKLLQAKGLEVQVVNPTRPCVIVGRKSGTPSQISIGDLLSQTENKNQSTEKVTNTPEPGQSMEIMKDGSSRI